MRETRLLLGWNSVCLFFTHIIMMSGGKMSLMRWSSVVSLIWINYTRGFDRVWRRRHYTDSKIELQHLLTQFYQEHFRSTTAKFLIYTASSYFFPFAFATNPSVFYFPFHLPPSFQWMTLIKQNPIFSYSQREKDKIFVCSFCSDV